MSSFISFKDAFNKALDFAAYFCLHTCAFLILIFLLKLIILKIVRFL